MQIARKGFGTVVLGLVAIGGVSVGLWPMTRTATTQKEPMPTTYAPERAITPGANLALAIETLKTKARWRDGLPPDGTVRINSNADLTYIVTEPLVWDHELNLVGGAMEVIVDREPEEPALVQNFEFKQGGKLLFASGMGYGSPMSWKQLMTQSGLSF